MSYGLLITNPEGKILIDGERRMPKLLLSTRAYLDQQGFDATYGHVYYRDILFNPTSKPLFVTQAIDETALTEESWPNLRTPYIFQNAQGQFHGVRLESLGRSTGEGKIYVFAWVYEV